MKYITDLNRARHLAGLQPLSESQVSRLTEDEGKKVYQALWDAMEKKGWSCKSAPHSTIRVSIPGSSSKFEVAVDSENFVVAAQKDGDDIFDGDTEDSGVVGKCVSAIEKAAK